MRAFLRLLIVTAALGLSGVLVAQEAEPVPAGPPPKELLHSYQGPYDQKPKETGLGVRGIALMVFVGGVIFLVMVAWYRRTTRDLGMDPGAAEDLDDPMAAAAPPRPQAPSPKETIFSMLQRAGGWVTPGRIALGVGLEVPAVEGHLEDLIREGRAKAGRDKSGRVLYRTAA